MTKPATPPANPQPLGGICWNELFTPDVDEAMHFYSQLFGWTAAKCPPSATGGAGYHGLVNAGTHFGGMIPLTAHAGSDAAACWLSYVNVQDVDASSTLAVPSGGKVVQAPFDIPSVGRMALLEDPSGARIYLYKGTPGNGSIKGAPGAAGFFCWHDLETPAPGDCERFYKAVAKWQTWSMPMGDSTYTVWFMPDREQSDKSAGVGGMTPTDSRGRGQWIPYITAVDVDATAANCVRCAGTIVTPPHDIPGAGRGAVCCDPHGAKFGLYGRAK